MITPSQNELIAMQEGKYFKVSADVTFPDGRTLSLDDHAFKFSNNYRQDGTSSSVFPLGAAIEKVISLELYNGDGRFNEYAWTGAVIDLSISIDGLPARSFGTYTVIDPADYGSGTIVITALDDMYKAAAVRFTVDWTLRASILEVVQKACAQCGITFNQTSFIGSDRYTHAGTPLNTVTCRDVIANAAAIAGGFARINNDNELEIISFDPSAESCCDLGYVISYKASKDDTEVTGVSVSDAPLTWSYPQTYTSGQAGYVLELESYLGAKLYNSSGFPTDNVSNIIWSQISGLTFKTFEADAFNNPFLEFGDWVKFTDLKGDEVKGILTDIKYMFAGKTELKCIAETAAGNNSVYTPSAGGGGAATASDYRILVNKPSINSVILVGDRTGDDLGLVDETDALTNAEIEALLAQADS